MSQWHILSMPSPFYITITFSASVSSAAHWSKNHLQNLVTTLQSPEELTFSFGNHFDVGSASRQNGIQSGRARSFHRMTNNTLGFACSPWVLKLPNAVKENHAY